MQLTTVTTIKLMRVKLLSRWIMAGMAASCAACSTVYVMDGTASMATPVDATIQQSAQRAMGGIRLEITLAPQIATHEESVSYDVRKSKTVGDLQFKVNPTQSLDVAAEYMNHLGLCAHDGTPCKTVNIHITRLRWLPSIVPNGGLWMPQAYIGIEADLSGDTVGGGRLCWVLGSGPTRWAMWASGYNLTPNFQIALRNAFTAALVCLLTPDSQFNIPEAAADLSARSYPL